MSELEKPLKFYCNHCQIETHVTKDDDCLVCGLSFPTGKMMYRQIQALQAEVYKYAEISKILGPENSVLKEENQMLKSALKEISESICRPLSMTDACLMLGQIEEKCEEALSRENDNDS